MKAYRAETLILTQKYAEAKALYKSAGAQSDSPVLAEPVFSLNTPEVYSKKAVVGQNVVALDLIMGNLDDAKSGLEALTTAAGAGRGTGKEIPAGLLAAWIYYYIRTGDRSTALELIKHRRYLDSMSNARGSLLKLTH